MRLAEARAASTFSGASVAYHGNSSIICSQDRGRPVGACTKDLGLHIRQQRLAARQQPRLTMADYDGDEQLQDAFEEGNGDANNDEVGGRLVHRQVSALLLFTTSL